MEYYLEGGSERHMRDIASIIRIARMGIDQEYVSRWSKALGVEHVWSGILGRMTDGDE